MKELELETKARKNIANAIKNDIDKYAIEKYDDGFRSHLGASQIGDECYKKLWLTFRWAKREFFSGRQLRLFQRGHREEATFIDYLTGIGCQVWAFDPNVSATEDKGKRQLRISGVMGHFGGSLDGICRLPEHYGLNEPILVEFKTNGTGRAFSALLENGVKVEKYQHYVQMCTYSAGYDLNFALYMNVNKNDDSLHIELIKTDKELGFQQFKKAENIILSQNSFEKLHDSPARVPCCYCNFKQICFENEKIEKNCRSCKHAFPVEDKRWRCEIWKSLIPGVSEILNACDKWESIL